MLTYKTVYKLSLKKHKVNVHENVRKSKNIALVQRRFDAYVVGASGPNLSVTSASAAGITLYHCPVLGGYQGRELVLLVSNVWGIDSN